MNVLTTNLSNNQLKITFLLSTLLHAVGFYILSGISFNQISRSPEVVSIKVTALVEKKGIQATSLKHVKQQNPTQSTYTPKLVSATLNEVFGSKPTLTYNTNNRLRPSKTILQAKLPKDIGRLKLASSNGPPPSLIEHQIFLAQEISAAAPKPIHKIQFLRQNTDTFATSAKFIEVLSKTALPNNPQSHISSKVQVGDPKNFNPVPLYQVNGKKKSRRFIPNLRNVSLTHGFTEESLDLTQSTTMVKAEPPSTNFSSLDLGELHRGFHRKIWQRVAKVKYYPRMARKRGFEGKPIVAFTLGKKGDLVDLKIIESSNYGLLNEAALETIRRGTPYPPIPELLGKNFISFNLPISYVLEQ